MQLASILLFTAAIAASPAVTATERPSDAEITALVTANMNATQAGDLDALLATVHPESQAQLIMGRALDALKAYKLRFEAPLVKFVSMSGEYALVRVVQRTIRVAGPDFLDNEIDGIWALKRDGGKWKYWTQMNLKTRPLASIPAAAHGAAN